MLRLLSLLFSALCATGLVAQQDLEARLDAVKEFARYFRKAKEEALQVEAVMTLKGNECVPAANQLLKLLKHKRAAVRDTALKVLSTYREQETFQELTELLKFPHISPTVRYMSKLFGSIVKKSQERIKDTENLLTNSVGGNLVIV